MVCATLLHSLSTPSLHHYHRRLASLLLPRRCATPGSPLTQQLLTPPDLYTNEIAMQHYLRFCVILLFSCELFFFQRSLSLSLALSLSPLPQHRQPRTKIRFHCLGRCFSGVTQSAGKVTHTHLSAGVPSRGSGYIRCTRARNHV